MGSIIATASIIAVRCVREKCQRLLVADEASYNQCTQWEWFNRTWDDVLYRTMFMGLNLPEMLNQQSTR
jgi:hypothetical protein